jgi:cupin fold WbuC family metalloprotein
MKVLSNSILDELTARAAASPRKRSNYNMHEHLQDPVQRLLNAIEPGTYIPPHRHREPPTWELFLMLRGAGAFLTFDDDGTVRERLVLRDGGPDRGIEIGAGTWHTIVSLEPGSVFLEVKQGPYVAPQPENRAHWAPAEGEPAMLRFESWFRSARPGDRPPKKED